MLVTDGPRESDQTPPSVSAAALGRREALLTALSLSVAERFERLTGQIAVMGTLHPTGTDQLDMLPAAPVHPLCTDPQDSDYCRQSWRAHLAELTLRAEVHWHRCKFGKLCAVVPVAWHRQCIALCQFVCPESMGQEAFEHNVEILAVLVENFTALHADSLSPHNLPVEPTQNQPPLRSRSDTQIVKQPLHPKVGSAIEYIDEHLRDTDLNAARVARHLEINATYLAHLFKEQTGVRMNRYIASARVDLAKRLLATTDWQVKRIARECGYANPDWFGHVFHAHTAMKPCEYRLSLRGKDSAPEPS
jgi:AraC-like DNA-binding protein